jgi:hypothetical protein
MRRWLAAPLFALALLLGPRALLADWEPEGTLQVLGTEGGLRLFRFETEPWPLEAGRPLPDNSRVELDAGAKLRVRYSHYLDFCLAGPARLTVYVVPAPGEGDQDRVVLKLDEGTLLVDARFQFGRPADIVLSLPDSSLPLPADQRFFAQASAGHAAFFVPITGTPEGFGAWPARFDKAQDRIIQQAPSKPKDYHAPVPASLYGELQRPVRVFVLGRDFNQDLGLWPRPAVLGPLLAERLASVPGLQVVDGSGDTFFAYRANNALKSGQDFFLKEMGRARNAQWVVAGNCVAQTALAGTDPEGHGRRVRGETELRLLETEGDEGGLELVSESADTLVARAGRPLELAAREAMEASSNEAAGYLVYHVENLLAGRSHAEKLIKLQFEGADREAWSAIRSALGHMDSVQRLFRRSFAGGVLKVDVMLRKEEGDFRDQWKGAPWKGGPPQSLGTSEDGSERYALKKR